MTTANPQREHASPYRETRANEFDARVGAVAVERAVQLARGRTALDIGCGIGQYTARLGARFDRVVGIDGSSENIRCAIEQSRQENITYLVGDAETLQLPEKFDTVFMMNILEHVEHPWEALRTASEHLAAEGRIVIQVPNARSFNRQLALTMGLIDDLHALSEEEVVRFGHRRVYDADSLADDIKQAGLVLESCEGIVFKPLTNSQMQTVCEPHDGPWRDLFVRALVQLGKRFPTECTILCAVASAPAGI